MSSGLKLLPCPFCGGAPVVEPEGPRYFAAFCERCDIIGPFGNGIEDAAKRWNTRAPSDSALVEALEAVRDYRISANPTAPDAHHDLVLLQHVGRLRTIAIVALAAAKGQP